MPDSLKEAATTFKDVEENIKAGEKLLTPYDWENYDIVLVPNFMFAGMENPQLTFYDESSMEDEHLSRIMTHEIAHSWFGNTVTYKNYEHFWLNEGFTTFITSNMIAKVHGTPEQGLWEALEWDKLKRKIKEFEEDKWPFMALVNNLTGKKLNQITFSTVLKCFCHQALNLHQDQVLGGQPLQKFTIRRVQYFCGIFKI